MDDETEGELIGAEIQSLSPCLFGAHIRSCAQDDTFATKRQRCSPLFISRLIDRAFRESEIKNLHPSIATQQHVCGLQIAVHESGSMRGGQTVGHLYGNIQSFARITLMTNGRSVNVFHDNVVIADVINLGHIWMVQRGNCTRLAFKSLRELGLLKLDGNYAAQSGIQGLPDFAHAAGPERGKQFIRPESFALCPHTFSSVIAEYTILPERF